jgi:two-component system response regulator CpxR
MSQIPAHLLLVDDDSQLAAMLHDYLELQGFTVEISASGEAAIQQVAANCPDLVILDVMLPGIDGFEVLRQLRQHHELPIIMLTARGDEADRILGLMRGADDYLPKPFNPLELSARIQAVLKRSGSTAQRETDVLDSGAIQLNLAQRELSVSGKRVEVTAAEMHVLEHLMRHPNEVLSRARLTELALQRPIEAYDRSIDTLISKLRRKLAAAGIGKDCIRGLRGHGYVLDTTATEK